MIIAEFFFIKNLPEHLIIKEAENKSEDNLEKSEEKLGANETSVQIETAMPMEPPSYDMATEEFKASCHYCDKIYTDKEALKMHLNSHKIDMNLQT